MSELVRIGAIIPGVLAEIHAAIEQREREQEAAEATGPAADAREVEAV